MSTKLLLATALLVALIAVVAAVLLFSSKGKSWGFKDVVKNPELWDEMVRSREDGNKIIEESKGWSDSKIASEVSRFLFDIKVARNESAKGEALIQLGYKTHAHVLRFLRDTSIREKLVKPTGTDLLPEAPFDRACDLLGHEPPPEAAAVVAPYLDDPDKNIRREAALVLGKVGTAEIVVPLRKALSDTDEYVRSSALIGLRWSIKNKRLSETCSKELFADLQKLMEQGENGNHAAELLVEFDAARAKEFFLTGSFFRADVKTLHYALNAMADAKVPVPRDRLLSLIRELEATKLEYPQSYALGETLRLLGQCRQKEDVVFLEQRVSHKEERVAEGAAQGLLAQAGLEDFSKRIWEKDEKSGYSSLTQPQRNWIAVVGFDGEVNNGGLSQYFFNSSGDHWPDALAGLEAIGAKERAEILRAAIAKFGNVKPSQDRDRRQDQLAAIERKNDALFDTLNKRYYASKEIIEVLATLYVIKNPDAFN